MPELDYVKIADALKTIGDICKSSKHCINCPFFKDIGCLIIECTPDAWESRIEEFLK